ncbi:MAG: alpha/beta hydrolase family protein [Candidatus Coproplasma sp.]
MYLTYLLSPINLHNGEISMILTPISLWKNFDGGLELLPAILKERTENGVKYEYVNFSGRDTGDGRVIIYGVLAYNESNPSKDCVLILQDSGVEPDEKLLAYFVKKGYSAFCVDYSGNCSGREIYTLYPEKVSFANLNNCKESINTVGDSAMNTCWYEWTAVGAYARRFLCERFATDRVGLIGIGDGGEIAWKLAYVAKFACAVVVNACGWRAYKGINKFNAYTTDFNDNNYKFLAGIDSQAYAQFVKCPMLLLCATGDKNFDYDRAYDTFSRINPEFAGTSSIAYSLNCGNRIDLSSDNDMFMFLDSNVKKRYVFIPKPVELNIVTDENDNLVAQVLCDKLGIVEKCGVYLAEDDFDFSTRNWCSAPLKKRLNAYECEYSLNVYEKSQSVFVLGYAVYSSGFTVWSKISAKRIGGRFRNSRAKSKIIFSSKFGADCFSSDDCSAHSVGGIFLIDDDTLPKIINMEGLDGVYSKCGLKTSRIMSPQFAPDKESILKFDVCTEEDAQVILKFNTKTGAEEYSLTLDIKGGFWQNMIIEPKSLKNKNGLSLSDFTECQSVSVTSEAKFALNNLIWL